MPSLRRLDSVGRHIANQLEHHRHVSFRGELLRMLHDAEIEYNPRYFD